VFVFLCITRLLLGVGVGGVYPLAATIAMESSDGDNRGRLASLVFSMQGVGTLLVPLVGMVFLYTFGTFDERKTSALPGLSWRLMLGIGALPGIILMPFMWNDAQNPSVAPSTQTPGGSNTLTLSQALRQRRYWRSIVGCAGGWFLFDITFYGNTLFAPTVLKTVFHAKGQTPTIGSTLEDNLCWQLAILALIGLPGYYISVCLMDIQGRRNIQLQGFVMMTLLYGALGLFLDKLKGSAVTLLIIYGLTYFFSNFGPNSTTFILPAESFPFQVRSSLNGFCAAMGKLGATVGSACFKPIVNSAGTDVAFFLCAGCSLLGVAITLLCVEDRRGRNMAGESFVTSSDGGDCREVNGAHA